MGRGIGAGMRRILAAAGEVLAPLLGRRPPELQVAALCVRTTKAGPEVLLVTSLDTGRWVVPKGWPMGGRSLAGAAQREAWEEAGVTGPVSTQPFGSYDYRKRGRGGLEIRVEVRVYVVTLRKMEKGFPEEGRRKLAWVTPGQAALLVEEPGLSALFVKLLDGFEVVRARHSK